MLKRIFWGVVVVIGLQVNGYASDFTNFLGMEFNTIPSGFFYMGSCKPEDGKAEIKSGLFGLGTKSVCPSGGSVDLAAEPNELPQHQVEISQSFQMGTTEVTLGQYSQYLKSANKTASVNFQEHNSHGDDAAVVWVSWYQVQSFLTWLNQNKPEPDQGNYRLPTEAEWEYAARAGSTGAYFFGDKSLQISRFAWMIKDARDFGKIWSLPVAKKQANPWGLYDIYGNVWEWVQDSYDENYYARSPAKDPGGPETGPNQVARGCNLYSSAKNCRSAKRYFLAADATDGTVGFRVVRDLN